MMSCMIIKFGPIFLLARPNRFVPPNPVTEFDFSEGQTARIRCPVPPGRMMSQYFVTWRNGLDPSSVAFYQKFAPLPDDLDDIRLNSRYSIDQDLSLLIRDVTPGDMRFQYQCLLGVQEPEGNRGQFFYRDAGAINLSLFVTCKYTPPHLPP